MQKSRLLFVAVMVVILAAGIVAQDQPKQPLSPAGTASVSFADGKTVTINYSRPSVRNRKVFGDLVPYGQIWRTGANSATSLKTDVDLTIGGAAVPAGSYTLYSIPGETAWKLVINKQTGQWGTDYDEKQDLARVDMKVAKNAPPTEQFTISLDKTGASSATLKLDWASTSATVAVAEKK
jgi:Protein of unknown function (DUF2911)